MIFATEKAVEKIIVREKTQTRRLVKPKHYVKEYAQGRWQERGFESVGYVVSEKVKEDCSLPARSMPKVKTLWKVGEDYAVQSGRGKPTIHWCPGCGACGKEDKLAHGLDCDTDSWSQPLRIRITSIRKEKLGDITSQSIKAEGFDSEEEFFKAFGQINKQRILAQAFSIAEPGHYDRYSMVEKWNPDVWVLEFSVVKE